MRGIWNGTRERGIREQIRYRWRKAYGGLQADQARRWKEREQKSARLNRLVAELSLDKPVLTDILPREISKRWNAWPVQPGEAASSEAKRI